MKVRSAVGLAVLFVAACAGAQTKPPARVANPFPEDTKVTFDVRSKTVEPLIALLRPGSSIELTVVGLGAGQSLEIDFHAQGGKKGPFAKTGGNVRGRYVFKGDSTLPSGAEDAGKVEAWKFDVILRGEGEADVWAIDPMIVVKN